MASAGTAHLAPMQIERSPKASVKVIPRQCLLLQSMEDGLRVELKDFNRKFLSRAV